MEEKNNTLEQFKKECYVINFEKEYPGYEGKIKYGLSTSLSEQELFEKYAKYVKRYTPYMLLSASIGDAVKEYVRNNEKFHKRAQRYIDPFNYEDGEIECFHHELIQNNIDEQVLNHIEIENVYKALEQLSETQKVRIIKHYLQNKSMRSIALEENTNHVSVSESIKDGIKNLKKILGNTLPLDLSQSQ